MSSRCLLVRPLRVWRKRDPYPGGGRQSTVRLSCAWSVMSNMETPACTYSLRSVDLCLGDEDSTRRNFIHTQEGAQ